MTKLEYLRKRVDAAPDPVEIRRQVSIAEIMSEERQMETGIFMVSIEEKEK